MQIKLERKKLKLEQNKYLKYSQFVNKRTVV